MGGHESLFLNYARFFLPFFFPLMEEFLRSFEIPLDFKIILSHSLEL